ncbi:glyoxalase [Paenibacillus sp. FSL R7-0273]|uniref:VOC family protein n=1 Tax=Paenibacillus sp. FSL R7-0273 TaxID=1536772 RepID=UPI0004F7A6A0|nr:VOC family protein [Paenibacillus sp. FSL R7-0273]AIQ45648.1 glyoxalase [Paenibacillus sp. FSL R7-0273]OMF95170.1 glyoxalase [Paenibacillus sp. FSL R7-0273]
MKEWLLESHSIFGTPDITATAAFYEQKLGFRAVPYLDTQEPHICLYRDSTEIILTDSGGRPVIPNRELYGYGYDAYFITRNQSRLQDALEEAGVTFIRTLTDTDYGNREFVIEDLDGRWIAFGIKQA